MQTYNKSIKSDNLQLIYKIIHTTYKKSIKTYNPLQEIYNPSLQVVYHHHHHHHQHYLFQNLYHRHSIIISTVDQVALHMISAKGNHSVAEVPFELISSFCHAI